MARPAPKHRRPRSARATALTAVLGVSGAACLALAITYQDHPAQAALASPAALAPGPAHDVLAVRRVPVRPLPVSNPVVLSIPAIGVHSSLLQLGLTAQGALQVPPVGPHYDQAGWYRNSPAPGSVGPAVIVGHVDSARSGPSVFFRLASLRPHDTVLVDRADGTVAVFAVDAVRRYHKTAFPSQVVYGDTRGAALRLITCGGSFDRQDGHYRDNVVVFASLVTLRNT